jgi:hypothetical protein
MNWSDPVDLYCERVGAGFWSEPVNALTNAAFLLVAGIAFVHWRRAGGRDWPTLALIGVLVAIGFGSFGFHTLATHGAVYLDVIPIAVFIYGYLLLALRRFLALPWRASIEVLVVFFAASRVLPQLGGPGALNGSLDYLPALAAMLILVWFVPSKVRPAILFAAILFVVSLAFRTMDQAVCTAFPLGTHFIWHLLNAAVLLVLLDAAISVNSRAAPEANLPSRRDRPT